jgi:hypothetical protein
MSTSVLAAVSRDIGRRGPDQGPGLDAAEIPRYLDGFRRDMAAMAEAYGDVQLARSVWGGGVRTVGSVLLGEAGMSTVLSALGSEILGSRVERANDRALGASAELVGRATEQLLYNAMGQGVLPPDVQLDDEEAFERLLTLAGANLDVPQEFQGNLAAAFARRAIDYVATNRDRIAAVGREVVQMQGEIADLAVVTEARYRAIEARLAELGLGHASLRIVPAQRLEDDLQAVAEAAREETARALDDVYTTIESVLEVQGRHARSLEVVREQARRNDARLDVVEDRITAIAAQTTLNAEGIRELRGAVVEHEQRIAAQGVAVNSVARHLLGSMTPSAQLRALDDSGYVAALRLEPDEVGALRDAAETAELLEAVQGAQQTAETMYAALTQAGLLEGESAEDVGTVLEYSSVAVSIGLAVAAPNPMSITQGLAAGMSLFARRQPTPSPEQQMLRQALRRLEVLDDKVDSIQVSIHRLTEFAVEAYKDLAERQATMAALLDEGYRRIEYTLNVVADVAVQSLVTDIGLCHRTGDASLVTYGDYVDEYGASLTLDRCLRGLIAVLDQGGPLGDPALYFRLSTYEAGEDGLAFLDQVYRPTAALLPLAWPGATDLTTPVLMYPSALPGGDQAIRRAVLEGLVPTDAGRALEARLAPDGFLNPDALVYITGAYLENMPFFEIAAGGGELRPHPTASAYLTALSDAQRARRKADQKRRLETLLDYINAGVAQQALLAGYGQIGRVRQLLGSAAPDVRERDAMLSALEANELLARNLGAALVRAGLGVTEAGPASCSHRPLCLERYAVLYEAGASAPETWATALGSFHRREAADTLEVIAGGARLGPPPYASVPAAPGFSLRICPPENAPVYCSGSSPGGRVWIVSPLLRKSDGSFVRIPAPSPGEVAAGTMRFTTATYDLLELRSRVEARLMELSFTDFMGRPGGGGLSAAEYTDLLRSVGG